VIWYDLFFCGIGECQALEWYRGPKF